MDDLDGRLYADRSLEAGAGLTNSENLAEKMRRKFILEIDVGSKDMQYPEDIGQALLKVYQKLMADRHAGLIEDRNENIVGKYAIKKVNE